MTARARIQGRLVEFDTVKGWLFTDTKEPVTHDNDDDRPSYVKFGRSFNPYRLQWAVKFQLWIARIFRRLFRG